MREISNMIRNVQIPDANILEHICRTSLGHETTETLIVQRIRELSNNPCYYIAVYEDDATHQVLGFIQAERYNLIYGDNGCNVIALAVLEDAQNQGIGKQLLKSLEKLAAQEGYAFIRVNCNTIRTDAHAFYQQMGYDCDKTQKRFIRKIV